MDGPGDQSQPVETTAQAVADDAAVADWVMARRGLPKIDVMGWSWGTTIAGGYAAEHPDKVNWLVLYAPVWVPQQVGTAEPPKLGSYCAVSADAAKQPYRDDGEEPTSVLRSGAVVLGSPLKAD